MKPFFLALSVAVSSAAFADVRTPAIFGSHMVLQRDLPLNVWGWASPGEKVTVSFAQQEKSVTTGRDGKWRLQLAAIASGENLAMTISANNTVTFDDILMGDVWVCSGQSNMEFAVASARDAALEKSAAIFPKIRLFTVTKATSSMPLDDVTGEWQVCSPKTVGDFSAVGYFFGRHLHQTTQLPMGLIHTSWGGTPAEAWTDLAHLQSSDLLKPIVERYQSQQKDLAKSQSAYEAKLKVWATLVKQKLDPVNAGEAKGYAKADFDDSAWMSTPVPGAVEPALGTDFDGSIWVRKTIELAPDFAGKLLTLNLGAIDDWDDTYFNGEKVGATGPDHDQAWITPRSYSVPGSLAKAGTNVIAVRIFDMGGPGGFMGPADALKLSIKDRPRQSIPLRGDWKCAIETPLKISNSEVPPAPASPHSPGDPATLYNAMIHPIIGYGIKGAIWYQGEANSWRAYQYRTLLPAMIANWRSAWGQGDFPFFIVQLANFAKDWTDPSESDGWAELREAQWLTARNVPNCGLAVAIDVGEPKDIHPKNKQAVGLRLALQAMKKVYGQDVVESGPEYKSQEIKGNKIILHFDHIHGGLRCSAEKLGAFAIAGQDQKFHWANAQIVGDTVEVSSDDVSAPVAVRYAWGSNPVATLYNVVGLPAIPFRTDDWEMSTSKNR